MIKALQNSYVKWFFLMILLTALIFKFSGESFERSEPLSENNKKGQAHSAGSDNFSEHLNALTQQLRLVLEDYQAIKISHQQLLNHFEEIQKKKTVETESKFSLSPLKERIEKLEKEWSTRMIQEVEKNRPLSLPIDVEHHLPMPKSDEFESITDISLDPLPDLRIHEDIETVYTIPSGATLAESITMSALIGRVPVEGAVKSPYPFKIILGPENLAANGLVLPDIQGTIVQGYSVGDMTLSCVRGVVTELTFLFPDGRIVNTRAESESLEQFNQALGYLSETDGNPCLSGTFYSNALEFLSGEIALGALAGAAKGLQLAEQKVQATPYGNERYFNGSLSHLLMGSATEEGASKVQAWWSARQKDSFDVVYVPSGHAVVINITRTIPIDYDPNARKLNYERSEPKDHELPQLSHDDL